MQCRITTDHVQLAAGCGSGVVVTRFRQWNTGGPTIGARVEDVDRGDGSSIPLIDPANVIDETTQLGRRAFGARRRQLRVRLPSVLGRRRGNRVITTARGQYRGERDGECITRKSHGASSRWGKSSSGTMRA